MIVWVANTIHELYYHVTFMYSVTPPIYSKKKRQIMAANVGNLKGYDHQFVDPPSNDLLCLICLCVARDPQQINCCGKVFCKECLEEHKKHSNNCPQCREHIVSFADKRSKYII
jgi:hypothetical protein